MRIKIVRNRKPWRRRRMRRTNKDKDEDEDKFRRKRTKMMKWRRRGKKNIPTKEEEKIRSRG